MSDKTVRERYFSRVFTCPTGVDPSAPNVETLTVGDVELFKIEGEIPRGHNGLTGVAVNYNGIRILPFDDPPAFLTGDDRDLLYAFSLQVSGLIEVATYNLGYYAHGWPLRFWVRDWATPEAPALRVVPITARGAA